MKIANDIMLSITQYVKKPAASSLGILPTAFFIMCLFSAQLKATPQGGEVIAGQANINQQLGQTTIQQISERVAINWQGFNVASNETVSFNQPNSTSIALNRIFDQNPSQIFGNINANGRVFLVNPNGLYFSKTARVNVSALLASGLDISVSDFMQGRYNFNNQNGTAGFIINEGLLQAASGGSIALLGSSIKNQGRIIADYGSVQLSTGSKAVVSFDNAGLMNIEINQNTLNNTEGLSTAIENLGEIKADGGRILLNANAAANLFDYAINNEGLIQAKRIINEGGVIRLQGNQGTTINQGEINAQGVLGGGGQIEITGNRVGLFADAKVTTSGMSGGGDIFIGGNFQGEGVLQNASQTYIAEGTQINSSALLYGDAGNIVVWSDNSTRFYGEILASAGYFSGDGALVEVSGKQFLDFNGDVNLMAQAGHAGTLLLDPNNIIITNTADTNTTGFTPPADILEAFTDDTGVDSTFDITAGTGSFNGVSNGSTIQLQANNDITVSSDWDLNTSTGASNINLILEANNNVVINNAITTAGATSIRLIANANNSGGGNITGSGILSASIIDLSANNITATTANVNDLRLTTTGDINVTGDNATLLTDLSIDVDTGGADTFNVSNFSGLNFSLTDSGSPLTINNISSGSVLNLQLTSTANIDVTLLDVKAGTATLNAASNININGDSTAATLNLNASGNINQSAGVLTVSALLNTRSDGGTSLNGANVVEAFTAINTTSGNIELSNTASGAALDLQTINNAGVGNITITESKNLRNSGGLSGNVIQLNGVAIEVANNINAATLDLNASATISQSAGVITASTLLDSNSVGGTILNGANIVDAFTAINSTSGNIELTNTASGAALDLQTINNAGVGNITITESKNLRNSGGLSGNIIQLNGAAIEVAKNINASTVDLNAGASISQSGGVITATTLLDTNSVGGTVLNGANIVEAFTAINNTSSNIELTNTASGAALDLQTLNNAGVGNITIRETKNLRNSGGLSGNIIQLNGAAIQVANNINAATLDINASAAISQSSGVITASTLLDSNSVGGSILNGANIVDAFTAINTTTGNIELTNAASGVALDLQTINNAGVGNVSIIENKEINNSATISGQVVTLQADEMTLLNNISASEIRLQRNTNGLISVGTANNVAGLNIDNAELTQISGNIIIGASNASSISIDGLINQLAKNIQLNSLGAISINNSISASTLDLNAGATISQSAGVITASTLLDTSSLGGTILNGANIVKAFTAINSTSGNIELSNTASGAALDLQTINNAGVGNVTVTETKNIRNSGGLSGNVIQLNGAAIEVANNINAATVDLNAGANISQSGGVITATTLLDTNSVGGTVLNGANIVDVFTAINTIAGNIELSNTASGTALDLQTINNAAVGNVSIIENKEINTRATISGQVVSLQADEITLGNIVTASETRLQRNTNGLISVGTANSVAGLNIDNTELNNISGNIVIGGGNASSISIDDVINQAAKSIQLNSLGAININNNISASTFDVNAGGIISQTAGVITASTLLDTNSVGGTILNNSNIVETFTAVNTGSGNIEFTNAASGAALNLQVINNAGVGNISIIDNKEINARATISGQVVTLQADEITLGNNITASEIRLQRNTNGLISLGTANSVAGLNIDNTELNNISGNIVIGGGNASSISIDGIINQAAKNIQLNSLGTISINNNISASTLDINAGAAISQTVGVIAASTLLDTNSLGGTILNGANIIEAYTAINIASGNIELSNAASGVSLDLQTINNAGVGNITITETKNIRNSGALSGNVIQLNGASIEVANNITAATVDVNASGVISQTAGVITASTLLDTNSLGGTVLNGANIVETFTAINAVSGNIELANAASGTALDLQTINNAGVGNITIVETKNIHNSGLLSGNVIQLNGATIEVANNITAATVDINASANISQTAGVITASTLLDTNSVGGTVLNGANIVETFAAINSTSGNIELTNTASGAVLDLQIINNAGVGNISIIENKEINSRGAISGQTVILQTDEITLLNTITATETRLQRNTSGVISLGTGNNVAGLNIDNAELNNISGNIVIGATNASSINIDGVINQAAKTLQLNSIGAILLNNNISADKLILNAGNNVSQTAGVITSNVIDVRSSGGSDLTGNNIVEAYRANNSLAGDIVFNNAAASGRLDIQNINNSAATSVDITDNGNINISATINSNEIKLTATNGAITQSSGSQLIANLLSTHSASQTVLDQSNQLAAFSAITDNGVLQLNNDTGGSVLDINNISQNGVGGITLTEARSLLFSAPNLIVNGDLIIQAGENISFNSAIQVNTGSTNIRANNNLNLNGGLVSSNNVQLTATNGNINIVNGANIKSNNGSVELNAGNAITSLANIQAATSVALQSVQNISVINVSAVNNIDINSSAADILVQGDINTSASINLSSNAGRVLYSGNASLNASTGSIEIQALNGVSGSDSFNMNAGGLINIQGDSTIDINGLIVSGSSLDIRSSVGQLILNGDFTSSGELTLTSANDIQFLSAASFTSSASGITLFSGNAINGNGSLNLSAAASVSFNKALNISGDVQITSAGLTIQDNIVSNSGAININSSAVINVNPDLTINAAGALNILGDIDAKGAISLLGNGINLQSNLNAAGEVNINAGTDKLTIAAAITTTGSNVNITAADIDLNGSIDASGAIVSLGDSGNSIGLGRDQDAHFNLDFTELDLIVADSIHIKSANDVVIEGTFNYSSGIDLVIDAATITMPSITTMNLVGNLDFVNSVVSSASALTINSSAGRFSINNGSITADREVNINVQTGITMGDASFIKTSNDLISLNTVEGDVLLGLLDAGNADVNIKTSFGSVLNNNGVFVNVSDSLVNVRAQNSTILSTDRLGASITNAITMDIDANGLITLNFAADTAFINDLRSTPIRNLNNNGAVAVGLIFSSAVVGRGHTVGIHADSIGAEIRSLNLSNLNKHLYSILGSESLVSDDKDEKASSSIRPTVPVMIKTKQGWVFKAPSKRKNIQDMNKNKNKSVRFIDWL